MEYTQWAEKYKGKLLSGLDSSGTYIPLTIDAETGINISMRPHVVRKTNSALVFGVKFRVAYTWDEAGKLKAGKVVDLNPADAMERLENFCKGVEWARKSEHRVSTFIGMGVAAGKNDYTILQKMEKSGFADAFLNSLQEMYSEANDGKVFDNFEWAREALWDTWLMEIKMANLIKLPSQLPEEDLGAAGELLNAADKGYNTKIVDFSKKYKEKLDSAKKGLSD